MELMEGILMVTIADKILEKYKNKKVSPGGEVYLNKSDSLDFILQCKKHNIPIWGIDVVKKTKNATISPMDKTITFSFQEDVYTGATEFINDQMNDEWNYATIVTD